jgi:hypothetical protein
MWFPAGESSGAFGYAGIPSAIALRFCFANAGGAPDVAF